MFRSYIAVGDSFSEGLGDYYPDGGPRGWTDRLAGALSSAASDPGCADQPFCYANLAIRGRKLQPVIEEQLGPALQQSPDLISFAAGGNDMLRPHFDVAEVADKVFAAVEQIRRHGSHVLLLTGPDPVNNLPMGRLFSVRGRAFNEIALERADQMEGVSLVDNFGDRAFEDSTLWSEDGLHLSPAGHQRVAANCMDALGLPYPQAWGDPRLVAPDPKNYRTYAYWKSYVAPWVGRRLTGRSSGDGRRAKRPILTEFEVNLEGEPESE